MEIRRIILKNKKSKYVEVTKKHENRTLVLTWVDEDGFQCSGAVDTMNIESITLLDLKKLKTKIEELMKNE